METDNPIRILFVEDVSYDAEIAARELQKTGFSSRLPESIQKKRF
jgi:hypothetical protein